MTRQPHARRFRDIDAARDREDLRAVLMAVFVMAVIVFLCSLDGIR